MLNWQERATCRETDPEVFFPDTGYEGTKKWQAARAAAICARCPVRVQCLEHALTTGQRWGVWGGVDMEHLPAARRREIALAYTHHKQEHSFSAQRS